jgi:outer membrane receptor for ferrienterochelin and colicin
MPRNRNTYDFYNARIRSSNYLDLEATWNVSKILQIRTGANNVLDKDPPLLETANVAGGAAQSLPPRDRITHSEPYRSRSRDQRLIVLSPLYGIGIGVDP